MGDTARPVALHLLRHADAGDAEAWTGDDDVRPLSDKGVRQAERLGLHLALVGFEPDVILSSPKLRASQTAEIVAAALGTTVTLEDRLASSVALGAVDKVLRDHGEPRRPVLVGHDPDFSDLLASLVGAPAMPMKKGALARVDLVIGPEPGGGVLRWLLPPDALPRNS
jgi:phosphohistidine phosphatase SixA